jgi:hypothetical protein
MMTSLFMGARVIYLREVDDVDLLRPVPSRYVGHRDAAAGPIVAPSAAAAVAAHGRGAAVGDMSLAPAMAALQQLP